jgi:putative transposase
LKSHACNTVIIVVIIIVRISLWLRIWLSIRDGAAHFHLSTFYKYAGLLQLKRKMLLHRRKNHSTGIRAAAPLQLLHADVTVFRTVDNVKAYIFLVQDNFSRAILQFAISLRCKAATLFELLKKVHNGHLQPAGIINCSLMTDDGSENFGMVQGFINEADHPRLQHIVAQRDVEFSNSMIEPANKNLKYRFLYHKNIPDFNSLCQYLPQAVDDFNNRPRDVLAGLTPAEVLKGKTIDKNLLHREILAAKAARIKENKMQKCCIYSF